VAVGVAARCKVAVRRLLISICASLIAPACHAVDLGEPLVGGPSDHVAIPASALPLGSQGVTILGAAIPTLRSPVATLGGVVLASHGRINIPALGTIE
jgi:hypothetical protein